MGPALDPGQDDWAIAIRRFRRGYGRLLEWVVAALMVGLAIEVTLGVVFRSFGHSLVWYDELASALLAWLTFYGSALASVKRAHISCPEVIAQMPNGVRRAANIAAQLVVIAFFALLAWVGFSIMPALAGDTMVSLPIPMNAVQSVIPVSSILILVAELLVLVELVRETPGDDTPGGIALSEGLH